MNDSKSPLPMAVLQPLQVFADRFRLATLPFHAHQIVSAFLIYYTIFLIISPALSSWLLPELYARFSRRTRINWNVHLTSFIQSTFICILALYVIALDRRDTGWEERLWGYSRASGTVQAYAAGYFIWDVLVSAMHIDILGPGSLAHAISALLITSIGFKPFANFYGLRFILYELSTPSLNIHWFLDKLNRTGSNLQFWNGICLIFTFFGCRLVWGSYQSFKLYADAWSAWTASSSGLCQQNTFQIQDTLSKELGSEAPGCASAVPIWLLILYVISNTLLSILNFYWFGKMVTAVTKRFKPGSSASK